MRRCIAMIYYWILRRRYRVEISGIDLLDRNEAHLILPNHPSYIDPQILAAIISRHCDFVPVVSERFLNIPFIGFFLRMWHSVPVSDLKHGNRDPMVLSSMYKGVMDALAQKKSVIIYPSGQVSHSPKERILNKQGVYYIVCKLPDDIRVTGVRISGLWGSMWSVAWKGHRPSFVFTYLKGLFYLLANLIFFIPKRHVNIEFVDLSEQARIRCKNGRHAFNGFLEDFYNINGAEKASYIRHLFFLPHKRRIYPRNLTGS